MSEAVTEEELRAAETIQSFGMLVVAARDWAEKWGPLVSTFAAILTVGWYAARGDT